MDATVVGVDKDKKSGLLNWLIILLALVLVVVLFTIAILALRKPDSAPESDAFSSQEAIDKLLKRFEQQAPTSVYSLGDIKVGLQELLSTDSVGYSFTRKDSVDVLAGQTTDAFMSDLFLEVEYRVTSETSVPDKVRVFANGQSSDFEGFYVFDVESGLGRIVSANVSVVFAESLKPSLSGSFEFIYPL